MGKLGQLRFCLVVNVGVEQLLSGQTGPPIISCSALLDGREVRGARNLHEGVGGRAPLRGKNSRTGRSRPASESTMNTSWWTCALPGGNPPTRCAVQKTGKYHKPNQAHRSRRLH